MHLAEQGWQTRLIEHIPTASSRSPADCTRKTRLLRKHNTVCVDSLTPQAPSQHFKGHRTCGRDIHWAVEQRRPENGERHICAVDIVRCRSYWQIGSNSGILQKQLGANIVDKHRRTRHLHGHQHTLNGRAVKQGSSHGTHVTDREHDDSDVGRVSSVGIAVGSRLHQQSVARRQTGIQGSRHGQEHLGRAMASTEYAICAKQE